MFAAFPGQRSNKSSEDDLCGLEQISCNGGNQCISRDLWCDSHVDCLDASDELACTCESRLSPEKICDGYSDCPLSSDEIGCFGCDRFAYSCFHDIDEFNEAKQTRFSACYTIFERCDGIENCLNGKDEKDCSILVKDIGPPTAYSVSHGEGYLHRNYRGRWYPVCSDHLVWAREACGAETGIVEPNPLVTFHIADLPGPFISRRVNEHHSVIEESPSLSRRCLSGDGAQSLIVHVKCPSPKCGIINQQHFQSPLRFRNFNRKRQDDILGIVGGHTSLPEHWPFIVAVYRNGRLHCGGVIHTEFWVPQSDGGVIEFSMIITVLNFYRSFVPPIALLMPSCIITK